MSWPASSWPASSSRATPWPCSKGFPARPSLDDRVTGFLEGLGDGFEVVASLPTDCDQTKGLDAAQDILTANPDVTAIYGACGPPIIGAHGSDRQRRHDRQGRRLRRRPGRGRRHRRRRSARLGGAVPRQDGGARGRQAALDAINGEDVEANIDTGTEIVTADNAAEFGG